MTSKAEQGDLQRIEQVALSQPLLRGLLRDIPPAHTRWSKKKRQEWLDLAQPFSMSSTPNLNPLVPFTQRL